MKRRDFVKTGLVTSSALFMPNWIKGMPNNDLPNILIIGDSISIGYTPFVRKELSEIAYVYRPLFENGNNENCQGTTYGIQHLDRWLSLKNWDIIHFNFGLHDIKHVDAVTGKNSSNSKDPYQADKKQYKKNLKEIVSRLKKTNAKLIFATTTPYPDILNNAIRDPGMSNKYNKVALKVTKKNKIIVNDIYAFVLPIMNDIQKPKNVHFMDSGNKAIGKMVADFLKEQIKILK